jgi:hypothetical protein
MLNPERRRCSFLVFGEGGKLRSDGLYLEMLLAWSARLDGADRLFEHVKGTTRQSLAAAIEGAQLPLEAAA